MKFDYLIEDIVAAHGGQKVTKAIAEEIIREIFENIKTAMQNGERLSVRGFGSFQPVEKAARDYKEPRNQTMVHKEASIYPKFIPSGLLKEALNPADVKPAAGKDAKPARKK